MGLTNVTYQLSGFNPRTRKGCDDGLSFCVNSEEVSIHAPVKDATIEDMKKYGKVDSFNPRTRKGCDYLCLSIRQCSVEFQSTHP